MAISGFFGQHRWLSNFWPATVEFDGDTYSSVEHAYQAAKTLNVKEREKIKNEKDPGKAKRLGKKVEIQPGWDKIKLDIMEQLVYYKFSKNEELKNKLISTGEEELIETNYWKDEFWGICNGKGENNLGKILMCIRERVKTEQSQVSNFMGFDIGYF